MRFKLRGQLFELRYVTKRALAMAWKEKMPKGGLWGFCTAPRTDGRPRKLLVLDGQEPKCELDTVIHEALHGLFWDLDEECVVQAATELTALLWKLGYRKESK